MLTGFVLPGKLERQERCGGEEDDSKFAITWPVLRPPTLESLEPRLLLSVQPYISEFLADNKTGLTDYQSDHPDWIEIHNPDTQPVDLTGWDLKDGNTLWPFPAGTTIGPEGYLVVFASGKGKAGYTPAPPAGELHTNFKISKDGEYLGLLNPTGTAVSEYNPFPPRRRTFPTASRRRLTPPRWCCRGTRRSISCRPGR